MWIRDGKISDPRWKKVGSEIRDKHLGSATLHLWDLNFYCSALTHPAQSPTPRQLGIRRASLSVNSVIKTVTPSRVKYGVGSPKMFIWAPCPQLYTLAETPHPPPPPAHLGSYVYEGDISQYTRRYLFVTPCTPCSADTEPTPLSKSQHSAIKIITLSFI